MSNQIRLHKEFGLNPTLSTCFYCGKETGEIALLGANYDSEAPMCLCTSVEPCPECKEKFKDCVLILEARYGANGSGKPQPTGRWIAIKKECVTIPNKGICFTDTETMDSLLQQTEKVIA